MTISYVEVNDEYTSDSDPGREDGWKLNHGDRGYTRRIKRIVGRLRKKGKFKHTLSKGQSRAILEEECSMCPFDGKCDMYVSENAGQIYQMCKIRSSDDIETVWLDVSPNDKPEVHIGDKFGMLTVEEYGGYDSHGNPYWVVRCDCGNTKVVRGADLLNGNTTSCGCIKGQRNDLTSRGTQTYINDDEKRERKYKRGSSRNPDGTLHKYPGEHHEKRGTACDEIVTHRNEADPYDPATNYRGYERQYCDECAAKGVKAVVRYNSHEEKECECCGLVF
jgi:hypothetical protein